MKRLAGFFAKRYFFSRKSHSVINIISRISSFAVGIPVAAMIILLSVFNGFEDLVKRMYGEFDPDLAVMPATGKVFSADGYDIEAIRSVEGVAEVSQVLEDNALLEYRGRQFIASVRGVDENYERVVPIEDMVINGKWEPLFGDMMQALVGEGVAYSLGVRTAFFDPIRVFIPRRGTYNTFLPVSNYREGWLWPSGIFSLDAETDGRYVIAPLEFTRELFDYPESVSSLMIKLDNGADPARVQTAVAETMGEGFRILTRYEQKASLYRIMTYEKWGIFVIILMVMIIASFSIIGSLVMLIIDKRADMKTLVTMGADVALLRRIFTLEGMLISGVGATAGLALGLTVCYVQMAFGLITIPADTFMVDAYPVLVSGWDIAAVAAAYIAVAFIITKFTVVKMIPRSFITI